MAIPADFKYDVRVRERLMGDGLLSESEVQKHLEALPDLDSQVVELTVKQPALQNESDRDIVIVRTSGVRPPVLPVRSADDDLPIIDDDDDDDDDLDLTAKKPEVKKPVEKPKAKVEVKADDEDKDDEDKDDEDKDDADKDDADKEKSEPKEGEAVDKEWGDEP